MSKEKSGLEVLSLAYVIQAQRRLKSNTAGKKCGGQIKGARGMISEGIGSVFQDQEEHAVF